MNRVKCCYKNYKHQIQNKNMEEKNIDLTGKNVVYVGGFGDISSATCKLLMQKGIANLMILNKTWNESAFNEIKSIDTKCVCQYKEFDITCGLENTRKVFKEIMEKLGYIDMLINGVGICDERDYELIIAINLTGTINTTLVVYELMDKSKGGKGGVVMNISSVSALTPFPMLPIYSATKGGVLSFTRALAHLEPKTGITLYTICPGITDTKHWDNAYHFQGRDLCLKGRAKKMPSQTPEVCAKNILQAIESNKNGATWMCDLGQIKMVEIKNFWTPPCKDKEQDETIPEKKRKESSSG